MPVASSTLASQKRIYAVYARFYDRVYRRLLAATQRAAVAAAAACGRDILEIGVGSGLSLCYFPATARVTGIDLSEEMLAVAEAKRRALRQDFVQGLLVMDACRLGFADASFDAVTAQFVLTLVPDPEQALDEMDRVLRPGGEIIVASRLLNEDDPLDRLWSGLAPLARAIGWSADFKVSRITRWAAATGRYEVVQIGRGYFKLVRLRKRG